jgi:hypothetical protein
VVPQELPNVAVSPINLEKTFYTRAHLPITGPQNNSTNCTPQERNIEVQYVHRLLCSQNLVVKTFLIFIITNTTHVFVCISVYLTNLDLRQHVKNKNEKNVHTLGKLFSANE